MEFLPPFPLHQRVYYLTPESPNFEEAYLKIRELEERIYPDEFVRQLPETPARHRHHREWNRRKRSTQRLLDYFRQQRPEKSLDLGCGNGWLTHQLAKASGHDVLGVDVNATELQQAARLFQSDHCQFAYGDIFADVWPQAYFDQIVLNSCVQYFDQLETLLEQLFRLLKDDGKIHLVDSPIYAAEEVASAQERSRTYYRSQGVEAMVDQYHHHSWQDLAAYAVEVPYRPDRLIDRIKRKLDAYESPFPWVIISKP